MSKVKFSLQTHWLENNIFFKLIIGIGGICDEDTDCVVENSQCENDNLKQDSKTCQCRKGYVHFKDDCHKEGKFVNIMSSEFKKKSLNFSIRN